MAPRDARTVTCDECGYEGADFEWADHGRHGMVQLCPECEAAAPVDTRSASNPDQ